MLGSRSDQPGQEPTADPITLALAEKTARKRAVADLFMGRRPQPRDAAGRFASTGFDGGARQPLPVAGDPVREHGELVTHLAYQSKLGRSDF